jgi:hypothetical protein
MAEEVEQASPREDIAMNSVVFLSGLAVNAMDMVCRDYDLAHPSLEGATQSSTRDNDAIDIDVIEGRKAITAPVPSGPVIGVKSGEVLDPAKVVAGRQKELDNLYKHDVVKHVKISEAKGGVHVTGGWVEDNEGDLVRSRFVAKQVAYRLGDDVTQSTPALLVFRLLLSLACSMCPLFTSSMVFFAIWYIAVAFFHAIADELIFVRDLVPKGFRWRLNRSIWDKVGKPPVGGSSQRGALEARLHLNRSHVHGLLQPSVGLHCRDLGDDFAGVGSRAALQALDAIFA